MRYYALNKPLNYIYKLKLFGPNCRCFHQEAFWATRLDSSSHSIACKAELKQHHLLIRMYLSWLCKVSSFHLEIPGESGFMSSKVTIKSNMTNPSSTTNTLLRAEAVVIRAVLLSGLEPGKTKLARLQNNWTCSVARLEMYMLSCLHKERNFLQSNTIKYPSVTQIYILCVPFSGYTNQLKADKSTYEDQRGRWRLGTLVNLKTYLKFP